MADDLKMRIEGNQLFLDEVKVNVVRDGLYATECALIAKGCSRSGLEVYFENLKNGNRVKGNSIMGLMTLEASKGTRLKITIEGTNDEARELARDLYEGLTTSETDMLEKYFRTPMPSSYGLK